MESYTSRREFLWRFGGGLGGVALAHLLGQHGLFAGVPTSRADLNGGLHHKAKAKRVIQLFMNGGTSQCDTFDYKPKLEQLHGKPFDPGQHVEAATSSPGTVLKSPFSFRQYGQCGRWVSSVFPETAKRVDDLAFLLSVAPKTNVHGPASYLMNTGFMQPGFPCLGSWLSYGLGSLSDNLPTFVVLPDMRGLPYNNLGNFSSGFLPVIHQGTVIKVSAPNPIADLFPPPSAKFITKQSEADAHELLKKMNQAYAAERPGDSRLEARIKSYELAARMQATAPEVLDIAKETAATRKLYGLDEKVTESFGRACLIARRMVERGVRFVQVWSGAGGAAHNWDNHANIRTELPAIATQVDRPIAALLHDLKSRGLFEDTLLLWNTEFGRQPFSQGSEGRDHNGGTSVAWLAGAGVKGGVAIGKSDEWSWRAVEPVKCYDFHATVLHLLGIDHEKLTFRHNGSDRRLTDVYGQVIEEILT